MPGLPSTLESVVPKPAAWCQASPWCRCPLPMILGPAVWTCSRRHASVRPTAPGVAGERLAGSPASPTVAAAAWRRSASAPVRHPDGAAERPSGRAARRLTGAGARGGGGLAGNRGGCRSETGSLGRWPRVAAVCDARRRGTTAERPSRSAASHVCGRALGWSDGVSAGRWDAAWRVSGSAPVRHPTCAATRPCGTAAPRRGPASWRRAFR